MTQEMEFCLLGPLLVRCDGQAVPVQRGKQRIVLAALLLNAGRALSTGELAEILWGPSPPPSAPATLRNYVKRLRHSLGEVGRDRISTQPPGYLIRVQVGELDVDRFAALLDGARAAARDAAWDSAAAQARAALSLWRGQPLADVDSETLAVQEAGRLAEMRLQALETRIDADLHLGRHAEVTGELEQLAATHPLREHLHAQLMLALYRDGRQGEALAAYRKARQILISELGAEPGTELRELHQQLLTAAPVLAVPAVPPGPAGNVPTVPRQLPAGVRPFTGRPDDLAALTGLLDRASAPTRPTVTSGALAELAGEPGGQQRRPGTSDASADPPTAHHAAAQNAAAPRAAGPAPAAPAPGAAPRQPGRGRASRPAGHRAWRLAAAGTVITAGLLLWAVVALTGHPASAVADGANAYRAGCDPGATTLASQPVRNLAGAVLGSIELRYSPRCHAGWARFIPAPRLSQVRRPRITVQVARPADGKTYQSGYNPASHYMHSKILLLDRTCLQATATITRPGLPPLTATTGCQTAP
jgi:DNA-binding SARP family transcriptional activator